MSWRASSSVGVTVTPAAGRLVLPATARSAPFARAASTLQVTATSTAPGAIHVAFDPRGEPADVPPVVLEVNPPSY